MKCSCKTEIYTLCSDTIPFVSVFRKLYIALTVIIMALEDVVKCVTIEAH